MICRPLKLTLWATLVGFLALNKIKISKIITNLGFVDFTPKKKNILKNAIRQIEAVCGKNVAKYFFVENYVSKKGNVIPLFGMSYTSTYQKMVQKLTRKYKIIIINTPPSNPWLQIRRKRPSYFFLAQKKTNAFNRLIKQAQIIELPRFDKALTYDGVHFTNRGNKLIFKKVEKIL